MSETEKDPRRWIVTVPGITPTRVLCDQFLDYQAALKEDDRLVCFNLQQELNSVDVFIHQSRLKYAGGPLAALVTKDFAEKELRKVQLSEEDDELTFRIIRGYLYFQHVHLSFLTLSQLVNVARCSHRWGLTGLFEALGDYITQHCLLSDAAAVRTASVILSLPGVSERFAAYFWDCAGEHFDGFTHPRLEDHLDSSPNAGNGKSGDSASLGVQSFCGIWDMALNCDALPRLVDRILCVARGDVIEQLLAWVLLYLEPRISRDDSVIDLVVRILSRSRPCRHVLRMNIERVWSPRAIRLFALCVDFPFASTATPDAVFSRREQLGVSGRIVGDDPSHAFPLTAIRFPIQRSPWSQPSVLVDIYVCKTTETTVGANWAVAKNIDTSSDYTKAKMHIRICFQEVRGPKGESCDVWEQKNWFTVFRVEQLEEGSNSFSVAVDKADIDCYFTRHRANCGCLSFVALDVALFMHG